MWDRIFDQMMSRLIVKGNLHVTFPTGLRRSYGPGHGLSAGLRIRDTATLRALCLQPDLALGEGYMDTRVEIENDDLETVLRLLLQNRRDGLFPLWVRLATRAQTALRGWIQRNTPVSARANVAHHYDISDDLYRLFLDEDMQYSCAYFTDPGQSLEDAQRAKKAHIAAKLRIEPGMRVLDIGCGWGGMALTLAGEYGARVTGVTLSENQLATARARARAAGLADRTEFRLLDYRELTERFDRIVSVGMLEHVGIPHYREYFGKVADLLDPEGIALIHTIGRCAPPAVTSAWILKYIFPGGHVPSLSELAGPIERTGLWSTDIEVLRLHYAMTLRHWRDRFEAQLGAVRNMYDDRFIRMWRFYLTACMLAFEEQHQAVFQLQLAHKCDAVPLTRDYLYPGQPAHRQHAAE